MRACPSAGFRTVHLGAVTINKFFASRIDMPPHPLLPAGVAMAK
jgi:hypothetical protein